MRRSEPGILVTAEATFGIGFGQEDDFGTDTHPAAVRAEAQMEELVDQAAE